MNILLPILVFLPIIFAPICFFIGKKCGALRRVITISVCALELAISLYLYISDAAAAFTIPFAPADVGFISDGFRSLYASMTAFMWLVTALFSPEYFAHYKNRGRYTFFYLIAFGATMGVFLSADLLAAFIFFEIVSFSSYVWVLHDESKEALSAARTYLSVAVFGGMILLLGLIMLYCHTGTLLISELSVASSSISPTALYGIGVCLLIGFSAKAGVFPLHIWLPKAHPVAPAPASALLSGVLTKVGVYGVVVTSVQLFAGDPGFGAALFIAGFITLLLGAVLALLSVDIKRTLACSSMSQIGFIVVGIAAAVTLGEENASAASGVVLYMLNHSAMKLILFLFAGVIHMRLHKLDLNDIRGWGRGRPAFAALYILGGAGLAGIPGTGGYIAKTLLHEAVLECEAVLPAHAVTAAELLFLFGGGCTLAYMLKLFVVIFVEKPEIKREEKKTSKLSFAALLLASIPPFMTAIPAISERIAGRAAAFVGGEGAYGIEYYGLESLKGAAVTITIGVLLYFCFVRTVTLRRGKYVNVIPSGFELENMIYVPVIKCTVKAGGKIFRLFGENVITARLARIIKIIFEIMCHALADAVDGLIYLLRKGVFRSSDYYKYKDRKSEEAEREKESNTLVNEGKAGFWRRLRRELRTEVTVLTSDVTDNFSYALILTCIGVCAILIYLFLFD